MVSRLSMYVKEYEYNDKDCMPSRWHGVAGEEIVWQPRDGLLDLI